MEREDDIWRSTAFMSYFNVNEKKAQKKSFIDGAIFNPLLSGFGFGLGLLLEDLRIKGLPVYKKLAYYLLELISYMI